MASKKDEKIAWEMLKEAFPDTYISLELVYNHYRTGTKETILYHAYVDVSGDTAANCIGKEMENPIEAVQNLIDKQKGGNKCRLILKKS